MNSRFLKVDLSRETDGLCSLHFHVFRYAFLGKTLTKSRKLEMEKGFDPSAMQIVDISYIVISSESYRGLASGLREQLVEILTVLEENGFVTDSEDPIKVSDRQWFNTGNDYKFVGQMVDFLMGAKHV
jgi:hypothetical protein